MFRAERGCLKTGEEQPEQRRAEQHARDHLPHHLRLAEIGFRGPADDAADEQDHRDLQEEMDAEVGGRIALRRVPRGAMRIEYAGCSSQKFTDHVRHRGLSPSQATWSALFDSLIVRRK